MFPATTICHHIILLCALIFVSPTLYGQDKDFAATDTSSINALLKKSSELYPNYPDSSKYFAREAFSSSNEINYTKGQVEGAIAIANVLLDERDKAATEELLSNALEVARASQDSFLIYRALRFLGWHHYVYEEFPQSMELLLEMIVVCQNTDNYAGQITGLMNSATIYTLMDKFDEANEKLNIIIEKATIEGDTTHLVQAFVNLSGNYRRAEDPPNSFDAAMKAFELSKAINMPLGIIKASSLLAVNYLEKRDFEAALAFADNVINSGTEDLTSLGYAYKTKASAADSLGDQMNAFNYAFQSLEYNLELNRGTYLMNSYEQLYLLHKKYNRPEEALYFFEQFEVLKDSIFNLEKNIKINELEEQYENAQNKLEIAALKTEQEEIQNELAQRNILLVTLLLGSVLVGMAVYLIYRNRLLQQQQNTMKIKQRLLLAQINPHFIFNSLNSIQNLVYAKDNKERIGKYLNQFSSLMRNTLESSFDEYIDLEDEIEVIKNYLDLQKLRFPNKFDYEIEVDQELNLEEIILPAMLTQPFLENAVIHAFPSNFKNRGNIKIKFYKENDILKIKVTDNGVGLNHAKLKDQHHRSRAIQITKDRLQLLRVEDKDNLSLSMTDRNDDGESGTEILLSLPLNWN